MSATERFLTAAEDAADSGPDIFWDIERSVVHLSVSEYERRMHLIDKTCAALRAVLAISPEPATDAWDKGYNTALRSVRAAIASALDGAS